MSENTNIDTATLKQIFKEAVNKVGDNPTDDNITALSKLFKTHYNDNKVMFYEMFSRDKLTLEQQKILFDSIEVKQKCQLYNTISVDSRKNFYNSLSASDAEKFKIAIRIQAVNDARMLEQTLLYGGMCTRDWDIQQIRDISSTKQNPILMNFESSV